MTFFLLFSMVLWVMVIHVFGSQVESSLLLKFGTLALNLSSGAIVLDYWRLA